ncbi:cobalt-precorrin 5A hydrolase [Clostridium sediminicola]|uniref:cobalt-precorrin 5A hydrolase n=1 Tax=Clostridium sediminicola TaxID=3114879 RepID=UPI0031F1F133
MKTAIVTFTNQGDLIAEKLNKHMDIDLYSKKKQEDFNFKEVSKKLMKEYEAIIFISSTGIAVRAISPYLISKTEDPAVVVIDNSSKYVISLLSGHLGGANELTLKLAKILDAAPIITTATDNLNKVAPDMIAKDNNLIINDMKEAKVIAADLVQGKKVAFLDEKNLIGLPKGYISDLEKHSSLVCVTNKEMLSCNKDKFILKLIRKDIVLGIGCRRNYDPEIMIVNVLRTLKENNIDRRSIKSVATVEIKKDEKAIIALAKELNAELKIFTVEDIRKIQDKFDGSDFVEKTIGVRAVAEPCVELAGGMVTIEKLKLNGMTFSAGELK